MYARSQLSGRRSANRFDDEAHGYRISPSQQVPKFVTASAKALMLLLFFPQHPHVIYAIRTATTSLRLKARKRYGVGTSCPSASMIRLSLPARTLSDQHTILRLPARISYGVGTSCPNTPNPRPAPVPHIGSNTTNWLSKRIMLRYSKSGPATAQPRSPSISGVMPIHPIGSYDRSGALDTTGKRRFPGCFPQASRPTA